MLGQSAFIPYSVQCMSFIEGKSLNNWSPSHRTPPVPNVMSGVVVAGAQKYPDWCSKVTEQCGVTSWSNFAGFHIRSWRHLKQRFYFKNHPIRLILLPGTYEMSQVCVWPRGYLGEDVTGCGRRRKAGVQGSSWGYQQDC